MIRIDFMDLVALAIMVFAGMVFLFGVAYYNIKARIKRMRNKNR